MKAVLFTENRNVKEELMKDNPQFKIGFITKHYFDDKDFSMHGSPLYAVITEITDTMQRKYVHSTIDHLNRNKIDFISLEESKAIKDKVEQDIKNKENEVNQLKSMLRNFEHNIEQLIKLSNEDEFLDEELKQCQEM